MKTKFFNKLIAISVVMLTIALSVSAITINQSGNTLFLGLEWNKSTEKVPQLLYRSIKGLSYDNCSVHVYFYENGLYNKYGEKYTFYSDTIPLLFSVNPREVCRYKDCRFFDREYGISSKIDEIIQSFNRGVDIDSIMESITDEERLFSESRIRFNLDSLTNESRKLDKINPFKPFSQNNTQQEEILEIPEWHNSLYYTVEIKRLLIQSIKFQILLDPFIPDNAPPLADDLDEYE